MCVSVCVARSITATFLQAPAGAHSVPGQLVPQPRNPQQPVSISALFVNWLVISLNR